MTLTMRETLHPKGDEAIHILEPRAAAAVGQSGNFIFKAISDFNLLLNVVY